MPFQTRRLFKSLITEPTFEPIFFLVVLCLVTDETGQVRVEVRIKVRVRGSERVRVGVGLCLVTDEMLG